MEDDNIRQSAKASDFALDPVVYNLDQHSSDETYNNTDSESGTNLDY